MFRWSGVIGGLFFATGLSTGCFSDPSTDATCNPGMEGCECVDLQCENGLMCMGGVCVQGAGSSGAVSSTGQPDPTSTTSTSSTTVDPTSSTSGEGSSSGGGDSTSAAETTAGESSSSGGDMCGDFVVGPTEECDGGNGCTDECTLETHECNPLNNVPCPDTHKCSWRVLEEKPVFLGYFTCIEYADALFDVGGGDCFESNNAQDEQCAEGLACYNSTFLDDCAFDGCCTEYCDTNDGAEQCSNPDHACVAEPDLAPGLDSLGVCR